MSDYLFEDLLVIDCASFIAGPAAGTMLADFGARVIKIEPPGQGDGYRLLKHLPGVPRSETNYPWTLTNRSKESVGLDLKDPEARAALDRLIAQADVFITNFPLQVRDRLRLNYEDIAAVNTRTIYASLTPYGETGPEAGSTGYDATAWWARSGLMDSVRASAESPPAVSVPGMGDHMAACSLYGAIVTALYRRQKTGTGTRVGTSLMANGLWSNGFNVQAALDGAEMPRAPDPAKRSAFTNIYRCRDDRWFILTILPQAQEKAWPTLASCVGRPELLQDPRFNSAESLHSNKSELVAVLQDALLERDWSYWEETFAANGITCGKVSRSVDHCSDPQVEAAGMVTGMTGGAGRTIDSPLYVDGVSKRTPFQAPAVGEHNEAVFREFGIELGGQSPDSA